MVEGKPKQSKQQDRVGQILTLALDATDARNQSTCPPKVPYLPNTRTEAIKKISCWADSALSSKSHICWVYGGAGCGKSTIAQELAQRFDRKKRLGGTFFFSRAVPERSRVRCLASTLAFQLARVLPETVAFVEAVVAEEPDLLSPSISLATQLDRLLYVPCKAALKNLVLLRTIVKGPLLIILDGIDECEDKDQVVDLVDQAVRFFKQNPKVPLRFIISGRIEEHMQLRAEADEIQLIDLDSYESKADTEAFIRASIAEHNESLEEMNKIHPSAGDIEALNDAANGSFAVASGYLHFILTSGPEHLTFLAPTECLAFSLSGAGADLDTFLTHTLSQSKDLPHFADVLSTLTLLKMPLSIPEIARFLGVYPTEIVAVLATIPTIVPVPGRDNIPVAFFNKTVREYLLDEERSGSLHVERIFLKSVAYRLLDTAIVHYEELSEEQWMLPLSPMIENAITHWPLHLDFILDADPSFDSDGLDSRYTQILSRIHFFPLFPAVVAILVLSDDPVPLANIVSILQESPQEIALVLYGLTPILSRGPKKFTGPLSLTSDRCQFRHRTIRDFVLDPQRAKELQVAPSTYTRLSQRHLDILFGLPHTFVNEKVFFVSWAKYVALAVQHDVMFELGWVEQPFNPVAPARRAVDSAIGWKKPYTIHLEPTEIALALSNVELAIHAIEARFPNAFDAEELDNFSTFRNGPNRAPMAVSQRIVSVIDILIGFKTMFSDTENTYRLCLQRGCGVGIQIESVTRMSGSRRFVFSLYQYETPNIVLRPS